MIETLPTYTALIFVLTTIATLLLLYFPANIYAVTNLYGA